MANNNSNQKKFNPSVGLFPTKSGNGYSVGITPKVLEELANCEVGGRLYLQEVPEEQREGRENFPHYRLTIFPAGENTANKAPVRKSANNDAL